MVRRLEKDIRVCGGHPVVGRRIFQGLQQGPLCSVECDHVPREGMVGVHDFTAEMGRHPGRGEDIVSGLQFNDHAVQYGPDIHFQAGYDTNLGRVNARYYRSGAEDDCVDTLSETSELYEDIGGAGPLGGCGTVRRYGYDYRIR